MEKEQLLERVEQTELLYLAQMRTKDLIDMVSEWFSFDHKQHKEYFTGRDRRSIVYSYMENFMNWKRDYSESELQDYLTIMKVN